MISKILFSTLVGLVIAKLAMAEPAICPDPSDARQLVYKQNIHEEAPSFGRVEKDYFIPPLTNAISCVTLSGTSTGSITSIGFSDEGIKVKLVSGIKEGIDAVLDVYTKEVV